LAKTRIRRKDLRKPDEFVTATRSALTWTTQHMQVAAGVGGAILVLLLVLALSSAFRSARMRDANSDLARAMATLRASNLAGAKTELQEVAKRWESTPIASLAAVLAANTEVRAGDADAAITAIGQLLAPSNDLPPYLHQQLLAAWGAALVAKGSWKEAADKYAAAGQMDGPYTGDALLGEARAREKAGETDKAKELYRKLYDQFPDQPQREVIADKLGTSAPAAAG
jgi:outer membrane protein assembly factor BamD (BamD/ComL family)